MSTKLQVVWRAETEQTLADRRWWSNSNLILVTCWDEREQAERLRKW
jgi:hypothetical protein